MVPLQGEMLRVRAWPPSNPIFFLKLRSKILSSKVFKIYFKKKSVFSCIHLAYLISCQDIPALLNHYLYAKAADSAVNLRINFQNIFAFTVKQSFTISQCLLFWSLK
jgi:hypothetical protein